MAPDPARTVRAHRYGGLGAATLAFGSLAYVCLVDPHRAGSPFPPCPFRLLTGWYCPACGGLRMTHDLLHGDLAAAVTDNVFLLVLLPLLGLWWAWRRRQGRPALTVAVVVAVALAAAAWTIVRNLEGFPLTPSLLIS